MEDRIRARLAFVEKTKKDLTKLRSRILGNQMSEEQYCQDKVNDVISIKNTISFLTNTLIE